MSALRATATARSQGVSKVVAGACGPSDSGSEFAGSSRPRVPVFAATAALFPIVPGSLRAGSRNIVQAPERSVCVPPGLRLGDIPTPA